MADRDEPGRRAADDSVSVVKPRRDLYPTAPTDVAEAAALVGRVRPRRSHSLRSQTNARLVNLGLASQTNVVHSV